MKSRIININFKPIEFDRFRNQAGLNSFALSAKKWKILPLQICQH
jgi:hypothetical protein